ILDRVSRPDDHRHAHQPGRRRGSAGRVVLAVQRRRAGSGIGQRERRLDAGARVAALPGRHGGHRSLLTREQPGGAQRNNDPSTPTALHATSLAFTPRARARSSSSGTLAGYSVYRDGKSIWPTGSKRTLFLDLYVTRAATYEYSVASLALTVVQLARSTCLTV